KASPEEIRRIAHMATPLFECCVDIGYRAQNTVGNADETGAWVNHWRFKRLIVVTSSYHMPRSLAELGRVLPGVDLVPHPVVSKTLRDQPWWLSYAPARMLVSEYLKFIPAAARYAVTRLMRPADSDNRAAAAAEGSAGPMRR